MRKRAGLTRIDLAVAVACAVFALATVQVYSSSGRERTKLEVCMANLRTLTIAWNMYADDQNNRIPCADVMYSHGTPCEGDYCAHRGIAWYEWPHTWQPTCTVISNPTAPWFWSPGTYEYANATKEDWQHCISDGTLWKYIQNYKVYKCPISPKSTYVPYAIAHSMNAYCSGSTPFGFGSCAHEIRTISQISQPAERMVFVDQGYQSNGGYGVQYDREQFYDTPPIFHGFGVPVSFADGHAEYHQWTDQRTKQITWSNRTSPTLCYCNPDLHWLQKAIWGQLGYGTSCP